MRVLLCLALLLAVSDSSASTGNDAVPKLKLNGWFPCERSKAPSVIVKLPAAVPAKPGAAFECAEVDVPLCHEGVCQSAKTINVFVKRVATDAVRDPLAKRQAMWMLQGGPGLSSHAMEGHMLEFNKTFGGAVDLYTVDHRGTGRSNFLECQAAQAYTSGSHGGVGIALDEVANCVKDILFQIDNHTEAFSVTSAAKDVEYLVKTLNRGNSDVFVYGASYGSYWTERIMHLAPKDVKGYILDGVVDEGSPTFTTWNQNKAFPAARFAKLCEKDSFCSSKLATEIKQYGSVTAAWRAVYDTVDNAKPGANACADAVRQRFQGDAKPSFGLRNFLGEKVTKVGERLVLPAVIHRFHACRVEDVRFLSAYLAREKRATETTMGPSRVFNPVEEQSTFLGMLIRASEMWTVPSPTWADEEKAFGDGLLSTYMTYTYSMYCMLRGNFSDQACAHLVATNPGLNFAQLKSTPFVYTPDRFWRKYAVIPAPASVLVFNGGLDFQTAREWGESEFAHLTGGQKLLVEFENGHHCTGLSATTASDTTKCGHRITASFVRGGGRVDRVDTSCVGKLPALDFADLKAIQRIIRVKSADELYDLKKR